MELDRVSDLIAALRSSSEEILLKSVREINAESARLIESPTTTPQHTHPGPLRRSNWCRCAGLRSA
jgi:hypothetical protein